MSWDNLNANGIIDLSTVAVNTAEGAAVANNSKVALGTQLTITLKRLTGKMVGSVDLKNRTQTQSIESIIPSLGEDDLTYTVNFVMPGQDTILVGIAGENTFDVTTASSTQGTITSSSAKPAVDDTVTIMVTPAAGYVLKKLTITPRDQSETELLESGGSYTFTMPPRAVAVSAEYEKVNYGLFDTQGNVIKKWEKLVEDGDITVTGNGFTVTNTALAGNLVSAEGLTDCGSFKDCALLTGLVLTDVTAIAGGQTAESPFLGCSSLTRLEIPKVTAIPANLFYEWDNDFDFSNLETVVFGEGLREIGQSAFNSCTGLKSITIPDSVTTIGDNAFQFCTGLETLHLGSEESMLESIGSYAFQGCSSLKELVIPDSVTSLGSDQTFSGCSSLRSLTLGKKVTSIPSWGFDGCGELTGTIVFPDAVESIDMSAFQGCTKITGLSFGTGLHSIGEGAFSEDTDSPWSVTDATYRGTSAQWQDIRVGNNNGVLDRVTMQFTAYQVDTSGSSAYDCSVTASADSADMIGGCYVAGKTVTLEVSLTQDYSIGLLQIVKRSSVGAGTQTVPYTEKDEGGHYSYSFLMPECDVEINAEYIESSLAYRVGKNYNSDQGTVHSDNINAKEGDLVALSVAPARFYKIGSVTVTGTSGTDAGSVPVTVEEGATLDGVTAYTFTMPGQAVNVEVSFRRDTRSLITTDECSYGYFSASHGGYSVKTSTVEEWSAGDGAVPGEAIIVSPWAEEGYKVESVRLEYGGSEDTQRTDTTVLEEEGYVLTMPDMDATLIVTFRQMVTAGVSTFQELKTNLAKAEIERIELNANLWISENVTLPEGVELALLEKVLLVDGGTTFTNKGIIRTGEVSSLLIAEEGSLINEGEMECFGGTFVCAGSFVNDQLLEVPPEEVLAAGFYDWTGQKNTNISYILNTDGTLLLMGEGEMTDHLIGAPPSYTAAYTVLPKHQSDVTNIVVCDGITSIGSGAFQGLSAAESVSLPEEGLASIGNGAFLGCSALTNLTLQEELKTVGQYALSGTGIQDIYYGGTEEMWMENGFQTALSGEDTPAWTVHFAKYSVKVDSHITGGTVTAKTSDGGITITDTAFAAKEPTEEFQLVITATPEEGFSLTEIRIIDAGGENAAEVISGSVSGEYRANVTMPESTLTITAVFESSAP